MSIESKLPTALQKQRAALLGELAKIGEASAALAADREAFRQLPAAELTPQHRQNAAAFSDREISLVQAELRAINALAELHPSYVAALSALQSVAFEAVEKTKAEIIRGLLTLGYLDPEAGTTNPCRIIPMYWLNHPRYRTALADLRAAEDTSRVFPFLDRRAQLAERLAEIKNKLAA